MTPCAACGRPALPLPAILLLTPLVLGALGAAIVLVGREAGFGRQAAWAVGALFALLVGALLWLGVRLVSGAACAGCGRSKAR